MSWAQDVQDFGAGRQRLNARAMLFAQAAVEQTHREHSQRLPSWAETQAAYRFLRNARTDWQALLQPHWASSLERMRQHKVVLNIHNTTELDFNGRQTAGLGPFSYEAQRGMYLHLTYAITTKRAKTLPEIRQVYVADREADILALLLKARDLKYAAQLPGALQAQSGAAKR